MKKLLLLFLLLLTASIGFNAAAQPKGHGKHDPKMMKEITDYKIKFLAQEMELKDDQKEKFAELYQKMTEEKMQNFHKMRELEKSLKEDSSEKDYQEASKTIADIKQRDIQLDKEYDEKFAKFLSQKQIYKMKEAEDKFRQRMHEMRQKNCTGKKKK